jgi:ribose/xylose/arabinose/galactoside ABC-type transport system permease subunit
MPARLMTDISMIGGRAGTTWARSGAITLTVLVSVLLAKNMPDYGRDIVYGSTVLVILLLYGRAEPEPLGTRSVERHAGRCLHVRRTRSCGYC